MARSAPANFTLPKPSEVVQRIENLEGGKGVIFEDVHYNVVGYLSSLLWSLFWELFHLYVRRRLVS